LWGFMFGAFTGFVQGRAPLKGSVYGRPTRGSPLLQGMPLLENSPPDCFWKFGEADFPIHPMRSALRWGFRRLRTATIGASRPPRPPRQRLARRCIPRFLNSRFTIERTITFAPRLLLCLEILLFTMPNFSPNISTLNH